MLLRDKTRRINGGYNGGMKNETLGRTREFFWTRLILLLSVIISVAPVGISARAQTADPSAILAQAKQASGGDAWDRVRTLHLRSQSVAGGLRGVQDEWDDVQAGRYTIQFVRPPQPGANGFDGVSVWTQPPGGFSYALGDEDSRQGAINQAYQTCRAYWFPERSSATLASSGPQQEGGRMYDVVSITPQGGRPFSVWIDQTTHLIDRFVEQQGEDVQIVRLLDYHAVEEGVKLPFTIRIGDGNAQWDEVDTVQTAAVNAPLPTDRFAMPPTPAPDYRFQKGKVSTTLPFQMKDDKMIVSVRLNGQGPFEAELDSGGDYIIQPALAERLQVKPQGAVQAGGGGEGFVASGEATVDTVDLGGVRLTKQPYDILSFSKKAPERTLLGLQILQRFVVKVDFDRQTLTLTQPDRFTYHGNGTVIPFHFQDNQPEVNGSVDGIAGVFTIDTGDADSLLLIAPFVKRYALVERYGATIPYGGSAVGGATYGLMTRTSGLALFGGDGRPAVEVHDPLTRLSQQKGGFDADRYVSGNVGIGILSQFNLIFDYSRQRIIFERNRNYGKKDVYNRTGLQLKQDGAGWDVINTVPASPAAEMGIKPGDKIVAINGKDASRLTSDELYTLFRQEVGTKIAFAIQSTPGLHTVTLSLKDVL